MKKVVIFFVFTGIALGLFLGIRTAFLNINKPQKEPPVKSEIILDELNLALIEEDSLNPILTRNKQTLDVLRLIYEPLINVNDSNQLEAALATDWMQKDDGSWLIKLRDDVSWHSGEKFTVDDVLFTFKVINSYDSIYVVNISQIETVEKLDESSIIIKLKENDEYFPYKLTFPIIPKYYWDGDMENIDKANAPVGTGAYLYSDKKDEIIKLIKNDDWWKNEDFKLKTIYLHKYSSYGEAIKAFKSSKIDVINTTMSSWDKKFGTIGINAYSYESDKFEAIIPNTKKEILSDSSVRRAILCAINRENIILKIYNGNAKSEDVPFHEYSWVYTENTNEIYDIEKAKQLLINASWVQSNNTWIKNNYSLKFGLMVDKSSEERCTVAKMIKSDLENIRNKDNYK